MIVITDTQQGLTAADTRAHTLWGVPPDVRRADSRMWSP